jgi:uncharacterized protein
MTWPQRCLHLTSICVLSCTLTAAAQTQGSSPTVSAAQGLVLQARSLNEGNTGPRNYKRAFALFQQANAQGSKDAEAWMGSMYLRGRGVAQDVNKARTYIEDAAASENGVGLRFMGILYQTGVGVDQNYAKAQQFYRRAIAKKDANSSGRLGLMYLEGLGVTPDKKTALQLLVQGANADDLWSINHLGAAYEGGPSSKATETAKNAPMAAAPTQTPNYTLSRLYYQKAADSGSNFASFHLGEMFETGRGVQQDYRQAAVYYKKAAVHGYLPAQLAMARLYEQGLGTEASLVNAYVFYSLAARKDSAPANQRLQQISHKMTSEERQQAEALLDKIHERFMSRHGQPIGPS